MSNNHASALSHGASSVLETLRAAANDPGPRRLRRVVKFAAAAGAGAEPFSSVDAVLDGDPSWWNRAPVAACRATAVAEAASRAAYRSGQIERARTAVAARHQYATEADAEPLIELAARVTHAADGPYSTLIEPEDILAIVSAHVALDDDALAVAREALRTYHFQIVVDDDVAAALSRADGLAETLAHEAESIPALAAAITLAEPLLDVDDAKAAAERAVVGNAMDGNQGAIDMVEAERIRIRREFAVLAERIQESGRSLSKVPLRADDCSERGATWEAHEMGELNLAAVDGSPVKAGDRVSAPAERHYAVERSPGALITSTPGEVSRSPEMAPPPPVLTAIGARPIMPTPFVFRDPATLPRRDWLYGRHLIRGEVSLTLAPGGVGKTSLAVAEATSLVAGRCLLHDDPGRPLRVWLWNGEEPEDELARRFAAVAIHYGLSADDFGDRLFTDTGHTLPLVLAEQGRDGVRVHAPVVERLVEALRDRQIDVMLIDPFVSTHGVNENDNSAIQRTASAWKEVAHRAGVAIGLAHHVRKLAGRDATAEDSRGGDALVSKARDARTLNPMSQDDASRLGISGGERNSYFSTGTGGKSNMAARSNQKVWFRLVSVGLGNSDGPSRPEDRVAVVAPWAPTVVANEISPATVLRLGKAMAGREWRRPAQASKREDWIGRAVADAFELGTEDGFEGRAKALIAELEKLGVLERSTTADRNRNVVQLSVLSASKMAEFEASA